MTAATAAECPISDFRAVYVAHHGLVWHTLHRFGVELALLDDAVQDVFVVAYRRRADYTGGSLKAWLYGIARRVASNYRRSGQRRTVRNRAALLTMQRRRAGAEVHEAIGEINRCLASLSTADRELFILSELEGMTGSEIARAFDRNVQTIYTRIRKVRQQVHASVELMDRARSSRPRASARSWALLVPLLDTPTTVAVATGWSVIGTWSAAALGTTLVAGLLSFVFAAPTTRNETAPVLASESPPRILASEPSPPPPPILSAEPEPEPEPLPIVSSTHASRPTRSARARDTQVVAPPDEHARESQLAIENELLRRAKDRLRAGAPAETLRLTSEHAQRFENSSLADLRMALRIEALCALDDTKQAREEARAFLREHPGSPATRRIKKSCAS